MRKRVASCAAALSALLCAGSFAFVEAQTPPMYLLEWSVGHATIGSGIAADQSGNVYVTEVGANRVSKFSSDGVLLLSWSLQHPSDLYTNGARGIATDLVGNVFVVDENNHRIKVYSSSGTLISIWGQYGAPLGQMQFPRYIGVGPNTSDVYISDQQNRRLQKFTADGQYLASWGGASGCDYGALQRSPLGIAVDADEIVYAGDQCQRIIKFTSVGLPLGQWGTGGNGDGQLYSPEGIAPWQDLVYVADTGNRRIQVFTKGGVFVTKWGTEGSGPGEFVSPTGVAVGPDGSVYVRDATRVQKFGALPVQGARATWGDLKARYLGERAQPGVKGSNGR